MQKTKQESPQASRQDNRIQDFNSWFDISGMQGWLIYKKELEDLINTYRLYMDNLDASGEMLKNYQLIKRGLVMALNIPRVLENRAKLARKEIK